MASTVSKKKDSLCRYFIRYGDCFHGENCQFIHALPPETSPQPNHHSQQQQHQLQQQHHLNHQQQQGQQLLQSQQQQQAPNDHQQPSTPGPQSQGGQLQQPVSNNVGAQANGHQQQGYSMNKLICSFKSDLPNEIDFAMQVATLLANSDNFTWYKDYPLVDAICSSLHVFICVCGDASTCYCYPRFWHKILTKNAGNSHLQAATVPPDMEQSFLNFNILKEHEYKDQSKIYRRIKTAAELMKQFSMTTGITRTEKNDQNQFDYLQIKKKKLKATPSLLKFVSLLLHCDDATLNLIGLDILSNTASKLSKIPEATNDTDCTKLVQMFQDYCVEAISQQDGDIYIVNRSIEVVSRLISSSSKTVSSTVINLITEKNLVSRIEQFLTSHHDVTLFLTALECCYRISRHQPHLLTSGKARYLLKILVNLLNCDDNRYFTSTALKRIKLIDEEELTVHYLTPLTKSNLPGPQQNHRTTPLQQQHQKQPQVQPLRPKTVQQTPTAVNNKTLPQQTQPQTQVQAQPQIQLQPPPQTQPQTQQQADSQFQSQVATSQVSTQPKPAQPESGLTITPITTATATPPLTSDKTEVTTTNAITTVQAKPAASTKEYACEWDGCISKFTLAKDVYIHVFDKHIGPLPAETISSCIWSSPTGTGPGCVTKRPKYSLLTHLNDFHCNQAALERSYNRTQPIKPPEHPGYAPNAALLAIRRHANAHPDGLNGSKNLHNQSPLSISVRLTAALILRNLATESPEMKQALENHEPLLSEICMTNGRDESKIIAECLSLFCSEQ